MATRYFHHAESDCVFSIDDTVEDPTPHEEALDVEEVDFDTYVKLVETYDNAG